MITSHLFRFYLALFRLVVHFAICLCSIVSLSMLRDKYAARTSTSWKIIRQFCFSNLLRCQTRINACNTCPLHMDCNGICCRSRNNRRESATATVFMVENSSCSLCLFAIFVRRLRDDIRWEVFFSSFIHSCMFLFADGDSSMRIKREQISKASNRMSYWIDALALINPTVFIK